MLEGSRKFGLTNDAQPLPMHLKPYTYSHTGLKEANAERLRLRVVPYHKALQNRSDDTFPVGSKRGKTYKHCLLLLH